MQIKLTREEVQDAIEQFVRQRYMNNQGNIHFSGVEILDESGGGFVAQANVNIGPVPPEPPSYPGPCQ